MESVSEKPKHKIGRIILLIVLSVAAFGLIALLVYLSMDQCNGDDKAKTALQNTETVEVIQSNFDGSITFVGPDSDSNNTYGLVFYTGAKVSPDSYAPFLHELAEKGWTCIVVESPFNFPFFNADGATSVIASHPEIEHWYVAGHSLGGVVASMYAEKNADRIEGLVLLAAYSTENLSDNDLKVVSVYGTNDGVLHKDEYENNFSNLPELTTYELVIAGGNHAQFGSYGEQIDDNDPSISAEEQISQTVEFIDRYK